MSDYHIFSHTPKTRQSDRAQITMASEDKRVCEGADCDKEAGTLQCPTCQKQGMASFFCSNDCFKRNWVCKFRAPRATKSIATNKAIAE